MAKNETDSGLFVALNHFSHLTLCLSEKMRRCFKSSDIFEKTSEFFHALAVTDFTTLESGLPSPWNVIGGALLIKDENYSFFKRHFLYF